MKRLSQGRGSNEDPRRSIVYWAFILEHSRACGDKEREEEARRRLQALGVTVRQPRRREEVRHGR